MTSPTYKYVHKMFIFFTKRKMLNTNDLCIYKDTCKIVYKETCRKHSINDHYTAKA